MKLDMLDSIMSQIFLFDAIGTKFELVLVENPYFTPTYIRTSFFHVLGPLKKSLKVYIGRNSCDFSVI